ncbi:hypothetical protein PIB30_075254 [Stylosanthes scabra]|uniref:Dicer dsRNA-binding fold domain-containing protein n=1 Tax=Stylosanthes scabra TaxID=79078 RepID=A0ABU6YMF5_9FABA|nr:hypothetical protein [Stylosanthes scabra]
MGESGSCIGSSSVGGSSGGGAGSSAISETAASSEDSLSIQVYAGQELVPEFGRVEFVSVDNMEQLLLHFCFELQIGAPEFKRSKLYGVDGSRLYAFEVKLPANRRGIVANVQGSCSPDESMARQDGAYQMVGHLRRVTGEVYDYHYERSLLW